MEGNCNPGCSCRFDIGGVSSTINDILRGASDFNFRQQQSHPLRALSKSSINPGLMATYGKRKKGLLSSFSVFHDEKPEPDPNQQRPGEWLAL